MRPDDHSELVSGCVSHQGENITSSTATLTILGDGAVTVTLQWCETITIATDGATSGTMTVPAK
ncbi:hypothetical protein OK016_19305 [Vibrio chagasii]|nr:hypothetical protein [Vibrio chagasii]